VRAPTRSSSVAPSIAAGVRPRSSRRAGRPRSRPAGGRRSARPARASGGARGPGYARTCRALEGPPPGRSACALRFRTPLDGEIVIDDLVKGRVVFQCADLDDFVVVRADGTPLYNFCVVVDDLDMRVSHVIRGDDLLASTPRQVLLYRAL